MPAFRVSDMTCASCVRALTAAVREVDHSAELRADLGGGVVTVDSAAPSEALADAMRDAGFSVDPA